MNFAARLGIPPAHESPARWHVAPWVDSLAYAFSWLPFLAVVAFVGDHQRNDYLYGYLIVLAFTDVHRHYGLPYVYFDRAIFSRHAIRFTVFPIVMFALFVISPMLIRTRLFIPLPTLATAIAATFLLVQVLRRDRDALRPDRREWLQAIGVAALVGLSMFGLTLALEWNGSWAWWAAIAAASIRLGVAAASIRLGGRFRKGMPFSFWSVFVLLTGLVPFALADVVSSLRPRALLNVAAVFAGAWNIWHVYMQKYGILRLYSAKAAAEQRVPGWVDRLLIFSWLPLYLCYLGTVYRDEVNRLFSRGRGVLAPLFDVLEIIAPIAMLPAIVLVVGSAALFLYWENRAHQLRNAPRLVMAAGTTLLAASFLLVHPLKAYLAYALSHAVEYMVFVWAFQRRRYREPLEHAPLIERFLRFPVLTYVVSAVALGALFTYLKYYGRWLLPNEAMPSLAGVTTYELVGFWTVYQSMVHFYFDGFLWKMRSPAVRATVGAPTHAAVEI